MILSTALRIANKGAKKFVKGVGTVILLTGGLLTPVGWVLSAASFATAGLLKDDIKGYDVYSGTDVNGKNIIVLIRKKDYDPKYDTIIYDKSYVALVTTKPMRGKIKG